MTQTVLLIAGQPKAGTTSLHDWLLRHPDVSGGTVKELRFFLDRDYPLEGSLRYDGTNGAALFGLFNRPDAPVLVDASPDYIGCETPLRAAADFPQATLKAILILREPVARMISAYRFFKARGRLPADMDFDTYIARQDAEGVTATTPVAMRALDHCRSGHYTAQWRAAFGDNLLVLDFERLKTAPAEIMAEVHAFLGLDPDTAQAAATADPTGQTAYQAQNQTTEVRSPRLFLAFARLRRATSMLLRNFPALRRALGPLSRMIRRALTRKTALETVTPSPATVEIILRKVYE